ncbi:MAG TPA: acetolactate synthase large subunit [Pseudonocardiaceae bacterium]|nr:acetolactate synthase large subunit [Pseudonocardiaceae bacterium]
MNGAQSLIRTLVDAGVDVCFANPGTSEMHFVSALDDVLGIRGVLGLFEGVVTGAADGYARMADRPAATLLHLGPGLANGLANLHNARRARSPMVNIVGDHALSHKRFDAPLESDIDALAGTVSGWVRRSYRPQDVGADAADAVAAAYGPPGQIATLILPADVSWEAGGVPAHPHRRPPVTAVPDALVGEAAAALKAGKSAVILLGGLAQRERGLRAAGRIAAATGARVLTETFPARLQRGVGLPAFERLGYFAEQAERQLSGASQMILAGARSPVTFFAYPDRPSSLVPEGCAVHRLGEPGQDIIEALEHLADRVAPDTDPILQDTLHTGPHRGVLTVDAVADLVGRSLPEGAIVVEEAVTGGQSMARGTAGAPRHDWLTLTGGAIGQGIPAAVGAAVACPDRKVINLQADGSAMYTVQALWTQARENLDVTTVILSNRSYAILKIEMERVGADTPGSKAAALLDLSAPDLDFAHLARGLGVEAVRATTAEDLSTALQRAAREPGPFLIDAVVKQAV